MPKKKPLGNASRKKSGGNARKLAIRARMQLTGEPYNVAARRNDAEQKLVKLGRLAAERHVARGPRPWPATTLVRRFQAQRRQFVTPELAEALQTFRRAHAVRTAELLKQTQAYNAAVIRRTSGQLNAIAEQVRQAHVAQVTALTQHLRQSQVAQAAEVARGFQRIGITQAAQLTSTAKLAQRLAAQAWAKQ